LAVTNAVGISGVQNVSSFGYDPNGNQITFTDANSHTTTNIYDALNRQVQVLYPDGTTSETGYDADGRSVTQTNQDNIWTHFAYDGAGKLIAVTNVLNEVTRYQYDQAGNEIAQIDALNRATTYAYDTMGRRITHMLPGNQTESFTYDFDGDCLLETNFNGVVITNHYDLNNRLTNVASANGYQVSYSYSYTGQRLSMVDISGTTTYSYDVRDRLQLKTVAWSNGPSVSLNYTYDADGVVSNIWSSPSNGVNLVYKYDPLSRLTNVMANGTLAASQAYDNVGNLQSMHYGNGVTNLYQYDSLNRLTTLQWNLTTNSLAYFSYMLGATGNRTNLMETVNKTNRIFSWQFDSLYRLTNETFNLSSNLFYTYDQVGNRIGRMNGSSVVGGLTNQAFAYSTNDWLKTDAYDSNGNSLWSTNGGIWGPYVYDVENHLTNYNNAVYFSYNGDGSRVKKTVGSTTTYYLLDDRNPSGYEQVLEEWTVIGAVTNLSKVYNYGLSLVSQRALTPQLSTNYFIYDGHGSTRMLTDAGGNFVNAFAYDAYGTLIASNGIAQTVYLDCGQQWDPDLGLYYSRARYLNPNTGRFWTMDSYAGNSEDPLSLHKYLYAQDNAIDGSDPSGHDWLSSVIFGNIVHQKVGDDFIEKASDPQVDQRVDNILALPKKIPIFGALRPDLVDRSDGEVYEIKPAGSFVLGRVQLQTYTYALNYFDPKGRNWHAGATYDPIRVIPVTWGVYAIVDPPLNGVILYETINIPLIVGILTEYTSAQITSDVATSALIDVTAGFAF
jgi:RHS repeat-associated protein